MAVRYLGDYIEGLNYNNQRLVPGYVREVEEMMSESDSNKHIIPKEITKLCIKYYVGYTYELVRDKFDPNLHDNSLVIDGDVIRNLRPHQYGSSGAFLSNVVNDGVNHWVFQIMDATQYADLYIGIWDNQKDPSTVISTFPNRSINQSAITDVGSIKGSGGYLISTKFGELRGNYDKRRRFGRFTDDDYVSKTGDIIEIILQFMSDSRANLKCIINGKSYGTLFVLDPGQYRAAIEFP